MRIVIPYRDFKGPELKYCLRGIEKFIEDPEITIIGDRPAWLKNVSYIPFKDSVMNSHRSRNIYRKIMLANYDFLFFNDDHFLLAPFSPDTYHYSGTIKSEQAKYKSEYLRTLQNTYKLYGDIKNFDTHCPIFYRRRIIKQLQFLDWTRPQGYCIKSIYGLLAGIEGTEYPDLKIRESQSEEKIKELIAGRPYFSTGNSINKDMVNVLEGLYPKKSIYEN